MKLLKYSFHFFLGTLLSRILGFVRDATIAFVFGASHITDAFFIAFRLPNTFRRVFGEGGFNPAFIPMYSSALKRGKGREFLSKIFSLYTLAVVFFSGLGVLLADLIISLLAPGVRDSETHALAVHMARFLFSYLLFVGISAFFMGVLNVHGNFFIPAFAQALFNLTFTATLLLTGGVLGYNSLILAVLLGGVFQVAVNLPFLVKKGISLGFLLRVDDEVRTFLKRLAPAIGSFGVGQLSFFIDTFLASFLGKGTISYLYYANRLFLLPMSLISTSVANVLLTLLSDSNKKADNLELSIRVITLLTLPSSAGLITLSEEIVELVYLRGNFSNQDALITSGVLSVYSLSLFFFSLYKILSSELFSRGDTLTPMKGSFLMVMSEALFAAILAFGAGLGIWGLPMGTSLSSLVGLAYISYRTRDLKLNYPLLLGTFIKALFSSLVMSLFLILLKNSISSAVYVKVPLLIALGVLVYTLTNFLLREELNLRLLKGFVKKLGYP